jgi:hypothetical protein
MHDATCQKIQQVAEEHNLEMPDSLRPTSIPGPKQMYHVNMSGGLINDIMRGWGGGRVRVGPPVGNADAPRRHVG